MSLCATCHQAATVLITARGPQEYRAILACPAHRPKARAWAARAGPPTETPAPHHQNQEPTGQSQLF